MDIQELKRRVGLSLDQENTVDARIKAQEVTKDIGLIPRAMKTFSSVFSKATKERALSLQELEITAKLGECADDYYKLRSDVERNGDTYASADQYKYTNQQFYDRELSIQTKAMAAYSAYLLQTICPEIEGATLEECTNSLQGLGFDFRVELTNLTKREAPLPIPDTNKVMEAHQPPSFALLIRNGRQQIEVQFNNILFSSSVVSKKGFAPGLSALTYSDELDPELARRAKHYMERKWPFLFTDKKGNKQAGTQSVGEFTKELTQYLDQQGFLKKREHVFRNEPGKLDR